jgi:hypothetical protein
VSTIGFHIPLHTELAGILIVLGTINIAPLRGEEHANLYLNQ